MAWSRIKAGGEQQWETVGQPETKQSAALICDPVFKSRLCFFVFWLLNCCCYHWYSVFLFFFSPGTINFCYSRHLLDSPWSVMSPGHNRQDQIIKSRQTEECCGMVQRFDASLFALLRNRFETLSQSFTHKVAPINSLLMGLKFGLRLADMLIHLTTQSCRTPKEKRFSDDIGKFIWKLEIKHVEISWVGGHFKFWLLLYHKINAHLRRDFKASALGSIKSNEDLYDLPTLLLITADTLDCWSLDSWSCWIVGSDSASIPHMANSADLTHASPLSSLTLCTHIQLEAGKKMRQPEVVTRHRTAESGRLKGKGWSRRKSSGSIRKISASPAVVREKMSMMLQMNRASSHSEV